MVEVCKVDVSGCFLRSEVCCFLTRLFSSAKEDNESVPETCGQICIPHPLPWDLLAEPRLWDEVPSGTDTVPGLRVWSQSVTALQPRARAGTTPSSECSGMCKCGHERGEIEPS